MQGRSKLTAAVAALAVFLGLVLLTPMGGMMALIVAALVGGLLSWVLRDRSAAPIGAPARVSPEIRRVAPAVAPEAAARPDAVMAAEPARAAPEIHRVAPAMAAQDDARPEDAQADEPARAPLFSTPGFGDDVTEAVRLQAPARRIAPSGDAVPAPGPRDIPEAARSIYGDAAAPDSGAAPEDQAIEAAASEPVDETPPASITAAANDAGAPDKLRTMRGLGLPVEKSLRAAGVTRFEQIAAWDDAEIDRVAVQIGYEAGRIRASNWVGQAQILVERKRAGAAE